MSAMVSRCQLFAYQSDRAVRFPSEKNGFCLESSQTKSERVEQLVSGWSTPRNRERVHQISLKPKKDAILKKKVSTTRKCYNCGSSETRQWVRGEEGRWLCHACGQYWRMNGTHRRPSLWHRPTFTRRRKDKSKNPAKTRRTRKESTTGTDRRIRSNLLAPLEIDPFSRDVAVMPYSPVAVTSTLGHGWPSAHMPRKPVCPVVPLPSFNVHFSKLCGV